MSAVLVAQAASLTELEAFVAIEETQPESSLMGASLTFAGDPGDIEQLAHTLNQACLNRGVPPWPGNSYLALAQGNTIYISWQKGMAWWSWILGVVLSLVLPALLGAVLWLMLPESTRQLIESVTYLGAMALVMLGLSGMTRSWTKEAT
jgi:hypothetical protein